MDFYGDYDSDAEQEIIAAKRYKLFISFEYTVINFEINDENSVLEINGKQFFLNEDDWNEMLNYLEKTFVIN